MNLQELLKLAKYNTYSYSGRSMYGRTCLAVNTDNSVGQLLSDLFAALAETETTKFDLETISEEIASLATDSMGRGRVIYWPDVSHLGNDEDEEDEPFSSTG